MMALRFLKRLGLLTGVMLFTSRLGFWHETNKNSDQLKPIDILDIPIVDCGYLTQNYNHAFLRGFYFMHRLPDWTASFLEHTGAILDVCAEERHGIADGRSHSQFNSDSLPLGYGYENACNPMRHSPTNDPPSRPIRPPKIKDDITCGKRAPSSLTSQE